jgi:hypothetical protein
MTRIGGIKRVDATSAEFDGTATERDFVELALQPELEVLQCSVPVPEELWRTINAVFFTARADVLLRVYGYYGLTCDLSFTRLLPNVKRFSADGLNKPTGVEHIAAMTGLRSLRLGIFELKDLSILERVPAEITSLSLEATRNKRASLKVLSRFRALKELYLEGHSTDIEVLGELSGSEDLTLRSITTDDLRFLEPLQQLWSLDIKLGGIRNFTGIVGKESIKYLELWQVRELPDIEVVAALPGLQNLFLQSLPNVAAFPQLEDAKHLRRVVVENMKGLSDFSALEHAPALEEFDLNDAKKQAPQQLVPVLMNPTLRRISANFGSDRKNKEFAQLREHYGKSEWARWEAFAYT